MELFSTFGGNTVACAVGSFVRDVVLEEDLQANALQAGKIMPLVTFSYPPWTGFSKKILLDRKGHGILLHQKGAGETAADTIAWTFSSLALAGMSQPDCRIKPSGPSSRISRAQYA